MNQTKFDDFLKTYDVDPNNIEANKETIAFLSHYINNALTIIDGQVRILSKVLEHLEQNNKE